MASMAHRGDIVARPRRFPQLGPCHWSTHNVASVVSWRTATPQRADEPRHAWIAITSVCATERVVARVSFIRGPRGSRWPAKPFLSRHSPTRPDGGGEGARPTVANGCRTRGRAYSCTLGHGGDEDVAHDSTSSALLAHDSTLWPRSTRGPPRAEAPAAPLQPHTCSSTKPDPSTN